MLPQLAIWSLLFILSQGSGRVVDLPIAKPDEFARPVYDGDVYSNPPSFTNWTGIPGLLEVVQVKLFETDESKVPKSELVLNETLPVFRPRLNTTNSLSVSWLGHSTVLAQLDGAIFLTDPIWYFFDSVIIFRAKRASPVQFQGPKRYRPPPLSIDELPELDFVLISHDHYDHLDKEAVRAIHRRFPETHFFVPLGLGSWLVASHVFANVTELNWGQKAIFEKNNRSYEIWCLPAQHWSRRRLLDKNKRLWSGWAVIGSRRRFYYAGDTGFCGPEFAKIGRRLGPFDFSAIPIGCYTPSWFMKSQHINPVEAVEIHKLVRSKMSLGVHWGTYDMGSVEWYLAPREYLRNLTSVPDFPGRFETMKHGGVYNVE